MKSFSQRKGLRPVKSVMQVESMDDELRNSLWNALTVYYWDRVDTTPLDRYVAYEWKGFFQQLWFSYFKEPVDILKRTWNIIFGRIKSYFFSCEWYQVYDFIEFIANTYGNHSVNEKFMNLCNSVLERELSAYRFVGGKITQITSEEEIAEIEEALEVPLKPVTDHLKRALDLLADKKSPDYRNSIKESISAVEAICQLISGDPKAPLGQTLKVIKDKVGLHPALEKAFRCLYGYTSDAEGIRHALLQESTLNFEDAKFMLVSCSAFVNYLITKSSKAGIKL